MEDANVCDLNHLDADVLLPPRKRLLAGFKRQNSDVDVAAASVTATASHLHHPPIPPPQPVVVVTPAPTSNEFQTRLNILVSSHCKNSQNFTPEQILEASKSAAEVAVKAAETARAAAQEKAMVASKAVAAAREALALVASFPEEEEGSGTSNSKDKVPKRNKLKKHIQVQLLYKKHHPIGNSGGEDEELARRLHRVINSSPRISKNSSNSEPKGHKDKKHKISPGAERTVGYHGNVGFCGNLPSMGSRIAIAGELDSEFSIQGESTSRVDVKKYGPTGVVPTPRMFDSEAESRRSKEKRRGRLKLKKLPLSICNFRDEASPPTEDLIPRGSPLADRNMGSAATRVLKPLFQMGDKKKLMQVEAAPPPPPPTVRKCQEFKTTSCAVKQNKSDAIVTAELIR